MGWRDNVKMAVIGGFTGLLVVLGYLLLIQKGVTHGEWLQFSAVFLGVGATIGGTLWLQGHTERERTKRRALNLIHSFEIPRRFLRDIANKPGAFSSNLDVLDRAYSFVGWARDQLDSPSYHSHVMIETMMASWESERDVLRSHVGTARFYPEHPHPLATEKAILLIGWLDEAEAAVRRFELGERGLQAVAPEESLRTE